MGAFRMGKRFWGILSLAMFVGMAVGWFLSPLLPLPVVPQAAPAPAGTPAPPLPVVDAATATLPPTPTAAPAVTIVLPSPTPVPTLTPSPTVSPTATLWPEGQAEIIGASVEGRPIEVYRFGHGPDHRMIVAGIHGGYEYNTVTLAKLLIERLQANPAVVPENITLFILPVLNVDGYYDYPGQNQGRANAHGVDLNRNFDALWQPDWDRRGCWNALPISAGPHPFSEPESQAVRDFILRPDIHLTALISYHSAAHMIFAGGQPLDPKSVSLAETLAAASGYIFPPQNYHCELTGQFVDWAVTLGIPGVDVELSDHRHPELETNWRLLQAFLAWHP